MKKALIVIGAIVALILIVALFLPDKATISRDITIVADPSVVFHQVDNMENYGKWSPWFELDPNMSVEYGEIIEGMGASYAWSGNSDVGEGTLEIIEWEENKRIVNALVFGGSMSSTATWTFEEVYSEQDDGSLMRGCHVTWSLESPMPWPFYRYMGLGFESMLGSTFEKGLDNLKELSESIAVEMVPESSDLVVSETNVMSSRFLGVTDSVPFEEIGSRIGGMYGEILAVLEANNVQVNTAPLCIYYAWNEELGYTIMEAAIVVDPDIKIEVSGNVHEGWIPAGPAATVRYMGSYDELEQAHTAIDQWMGENDRSPSGPPWEMYVTDPKSEPDTNKWITEVFYPIQYN